MGWNRLDDEGVTGAPTRTVLVADGQRMFAEAVAIALRSHPGLHVLSEHPTTGTAALEVAMRDEPDVLLLDYWLLGMNGPACTRAVHERCPDAKVLLLSWLHGPQHVQEALAAGAVGFLPKSLTFDQLVEAIRRACSGEPLVFAEQLARLVDDIERRARESEERAKRLATLSTRELEVLDLLGKGLSPKEIALNLDISVGTVKNHIHSILTKTGGRTQLEAILVARYHRVIGDLRPPPSPRPGPYFWTP